MLDTRRQAAKILGKLQISSARRLSKLIIVGLIAAGITFFSNYTGLDPAP